MRIHDLTGQRFGKLLVIKDSGKRNQDRVLWECKCDCGAIRDVLGTSLSFGEIKSCGRHSIKEMVGKRFGRLLVIKQAKPEIKHGKSKAIWWTCRCDCGNIKDLNGATLRCGHVRSCGCLVKEVMHEINSISYGEASFNGLFNAYKSSARHKGMLFELSKDDFRILTKNNCFYCGSSPSSIATRPTRNGEYIYNGIDRVDNSKGYTLDNCVSCCGFCNRMKLTAKKEDFLNQVKKIYEFYFEDNRDGI